MSRRKLIRPPSRDRSAGVAGRRRMKYSRAIPDIACALISALLLVIAVPLGIVLMLLFSLLDGLVRLFTTPRRKSRA